MRVDDLQSIKIKLASPEDILLWSRGEVTQPETINYRTMRPEKDGLFDEVIFGPEKDYQCYCGKYKRVRYKGIVCDRCGVEVTSSAVRRERMGHIKLASPVSHIWFLRGVPSRMGLVLNLPGQQLEKVIYFASYIVTKVDPTAKKQVLQDIEREYKEKLKAKKLKAKGAEAQELKLARDREIESVMALKPFKVLPEADYQRLALKYGHIFAAGTGAEAVKQIFDKLDIKKEVETLRKNLAQQESSGKRRSLLRLRLLEGMIREQIKASWMFLEVIPVLPPDLRPMVQLDGGRFASSDLNDLYRRVINRNNRLKYLLEISAPEVIVRNEKRMLQEAVDALIDNSMRKGTMTRATTGGRRLLKSLADMIKGKHGRFRQNLLGKRVDYSGRSVIVVGPELKLSQCGLPKQMALELFKPFVMQKVLEQELAFNVRGASRFIEDQGDEVWAILEQVVKDKLVLLNRAPTLHRLGIQAFEPLLIEGDAIKIHPLVCKAYNADFDGDQMAVHLPLSQPAQQEARKRMWSVLNLLKPATGKPITGPSQEMVMGCFWLTREKPGALGEGRVFGSFKEAILAWESQIVDLRARIKVKSKGADNAANFRSAKAAFIETTVGRILLNEVLPENYPYQNEPMPAKKLEALIANLINHYPREVAVKTLDAIKNLGFEFATLSGISWGMDDLIVPEQKPAIVEAAESEIEKIEQQFRIGLLSRQERRLKIIEVWQRAKTEIEKIVPKLLLQDGPVVTMVESGSRGSWLQVVQMAGIKGLVINPAGQIIELPVRSSYQEGFSVLEYFISTHGARKGTVDTALRTSTAGYLTRRLVDVAHEVIVQEEDCGDKKGFEVLRQDAEELGQNYVFKIVGRMAAEDIEIPNAKIPAETKARQKQQMSNKIQNSHAEGARLAQQSWAAKSEIFIKKGQIIDWQKAEQIAEANVARVKVFTPLTCQSAKGVCQKCYGWSLATNELVDLGEAVGIVAAQAIGEPGTQLTMKTFHTGGVAGGGDITIGLPRVEEIFEMRSPGGKAVLAHVEGEVVGVSRDNVIKIKVSGNSQKTRGTDPAQEGKRTEVEYAIPADRAVWAQKGDKVKKGQQLCEGSVDIKELAKLVRIDEIWRHIIKEIQKIYVSQGVVIHDKHLEIIVRQMFARARVRERGDSNFVPGEILERAVFEQECERLKKLGKTPPSARRLLLGISRVALSTDSFLSAASFQETSRVLIRASLAGKEDQLRGLKENVIIGKLIPTGTGFGLRKS